MDSNPDASLSKDEINSFPLYRYSGEILLVNTPEELSRTVDRLSREEIIGFDTETKPSFRKGTVNRPALLQMAAGNIVYLIQLRKFPLGPEIAGILENPHIIKSGVAIADDIRALRAMHEFEPAGLADLSVLARKNNLRNYSLRALAAIFLGVRISKSARCTNWSNLQLNRQQISYAATDAWVSRLIWLRMRESGLNMNPDK